MLVYNRKGETEQQPLLLLTKQTGNLKYSTITRLALLRVYVRVPRLLLARKIPGKTLLAMCRCGDKL